MPLTTSFNEMVRADLQKSKSFRQAFLREAVSRLISGDMDTGKSTLRKYINGTVGFIKLGAALGKSPKALMRMFSPSGNPQARNLFEVIAYLQKVDGTILTVVGKKAA